MIKIEFTPEQFNQLVELIHHGVKTIGLPCVQQAANITSKLELARQTSLKDNLEDDDKS